MNKPQFDTSTHTHGRTCAHTHTHTRTHTRTHTHAHTTLFSTTVGVCIFQETRPQKRGNKLLIYDIVFFVAGIVIGVVGRNVGVTNQLVLLIGFPGEIYTRLLRMIPILLVISSIISGRYRHAFARYIIINGSTNVVC